MGLSPASAVVQPGGQLVGDVAASRTPHVLDGEVFSVAQVGSQMVLGGTFTKARNDGATAELGRASLLAFDATSGQISTSFVPQPDGVVNVVLPAPDGQSVFVGGKFTSIGGQARKNLAQVRIADGAVLPFDAGNISGQVKDLRLAGGRLWLAGQFTHVAGHNQVALATVDARSGAFLPFMNLDIAGIHSGGATQVIKIDVTAKGDRLVAVGNFDTLQGVVRHQLLQLDISGDSARETSFNTRFFNSACATGFDTYMRDVDFSPDGRFFVVSTTGGYGGPESACDMTARFETYASGATAPPRGSTTPAATRRTAWRSPTRSSTSAATSAGRTTPSARTRVRPAPWRAPASRPSTPSNGLPLLLEPRPHPRHRRLRLPGRPRPACGSPPTPTASAPAPRSTSAGWPACPPAVTTFPAIRSAELPNDVYTVGTSAVSARSFRGGAAGAARSVPRPHRQHRQGRVHDQRLALRRPVRRHLHPPQLRRHDLRLAAKP